MMVIEQNPLIEGWKSTQQVKYKHFKSECFVDGNTVTMPVHEHMVGN